MMPDAASAMDKAAPAREGRDAALVAALGARSIVLIGMMAVGKSSIGKRLAARLHLPFVDADAEIELAAGMTIPEIFESHGEAYFRDGEARVIARLLDSGPGVLSTGGGAFLREETRARVAQKGISLWIDADPELILRRARRRSDRPLLKTANQAETIVKLLAERSPFYRLADCKVMSRDVPHERIVEECVDTLYARLCGGGVDEGHA